MSDETEVRPAEAIDVGATRDRITAHLVGRERELELTLAAVAAGRDIVLEGPPGTSKTTMLKAITEEWGIPLLFVEGNADLTPAKLVGHHNPARVLREDYSADNFVPGPLVEAMERGGFLYIEEFNRAPEDTLNTLLTAMADRSISIPRVGTVVAESTFRVIASMNPYDNVGTTRLSTSVHDRLNRLSIDYQDEAAERGIVALRTRGARQAADARGDGARGGGDGDGARGDGARGGGGLRAELGEHLIADAVAVTRATREHPDVRQGSSVRGAIDCVLVGLQLAGLRGLCSPWPDESHGEGAIRAGATGQRYQALVYDAMVVALSGRIHVDESVETTPEQVLREIWEDRFILQPAAAAPG